jgi:hypothetical protein
MNNTRIAFNNDYCGLNDGCPERVMLNLRNGARCKDLHTNATTADLTEMSARYRARYIPRCATA